MERVSRPTFSKSLEDPDNPINQLNCLFTLFNETLHLIYFFFFPSTLETFTCKDQIRSNFGPKPNFSKFSVLKSYWMCPLTTTELNRNRYPLKYLKKKSKYLKIAHFWRCSHSEWLRSQRWHDEGNVKFLWEEWEQKDDLTLTLPYSKLICLK